MGASPSISVGDHESSLNNDTGTLVALSASEKLPSNEIEKASEIVWLINFSQFLIYGKYPPPKPKHNNLNEAVRIDYIPLHLVPRESALIVYVSHTWWSGEVQEADSKFNYKYKLCVEGIQKIKDTYASGMRDCYVYLDYSCCGAEFSTYLHLNGNYYFRTEFVESILATSGGGSVTTLPQSQEQLQVEVQQLASSKQQQYRAVENYITAVSYADCIFTPLYEERVYVDGVDSNFDVEECALEQSGFVDYAHESYMAAEWNKESNPKSYLYDSICRLDMLLAANLPLPPTRDSRYVGFQGIFSHLLKCGYRPHFLYGSRESHNGKYVRRRQCNLHMPIVLPSLSNKDLLSHYHPMQGRMRGGTTSELESMLYIGQVLNTINPLIQQRSKAQEKPVVVASIPTKSSSNLATSSSKSVFTDNYLFESWKSDKSNNKNNNSKKSYYNASSRKEKEKEKEKEEFREGQEMHISYRYGNGDVFKGNCIITRGNVPLPEITDIEVQREQSNKKSVDVLTSGSKKKKKITVSQEEEDDHDDGFDRLPRGWTIIRHGHGIFKKKEGDLYIGEFQDDKMCGYGVFKYSRHTTVGSIAPTAVSTVETSATMMKLDEMTTGSAESLFSLGGVGSRVGSAHISGVTSAGGVYRGEFKDNMRDGYGVFQSTPQFSATWSLTDKIPYAVVQSLRGGSYFNSFSSGFENNLINRLFSDSSCDTASASSVANTLQQSKRHSYYHVYSSRPRGDMSFKKWQEVSLQRSNVYQYEGQFKHDRKDGFGAIRFLDGDFYIGEWKEDFMHGKGYYYSSTGEIFEGIWFNGFIDCF